MDCFNHDNVAAVGTCKSCGRAVCRSCARDITYAISCSPACESEAKELHEMNTKAKRIYGIGGAKQVFPLAVLMWGLFAVMFGGFGVYSTFVRGRADWFSLVFGAVCLVLAVVTFRRTKALQLNC